MSVTIERVHEIWAEQALKTGKEILSGIESNSMLVNGMAEAWAKHVSSHIGDQEIKYLVAQLQEVPEEDIRDDVCGTMHDSVRAWYGKRKKRLIEICGEVSGEIAAETLSEAGILNEIVRVLAARFAASSVSVMSQSDRLSEVHSLMCADPVTVREKIKKQLYAYVRDFALQAAHEVKK